MIINRLIDHNVQLVEEIKSYVLTINKAALSKVLKDMDRHQLFTRGLGED